MGMVGTLPLCFRDPNSIKITRLVWDVGEQGIVGENASLPDKGITFLLNPILQM